MEKHKNLPMMRFPEYNQDWLTIEIEKVCDKTISYGIVQTGVNIENGIPCVRVIDLTSDILDVSKMITTSVDISKSYKKTILEKDDIIIALRGVIGKVIKATPELIGCNITRGVARISCDKKQVLPEYMLWAIRSPKFIEELNKRVNGSALQEIPLSGLRAVPISITTLPEQTKIATFLTALDERLSQLKQKKTLLEQYKKGVMQKIFDLEIRFKDDEGNEFPDWKEKKLSVIAVKKSSNIAANKIENNSGNYIIYGASGILKKIDFYEEENEYISIIKDGAGVGRIFYCDSKTSVLGTMDIIKPKSEINTYFLYCLLNNIDFVKYVTGSTIPHIYFKDYSQEICGIPNQVEQTKIANFLSAIDEKINCCTDQINKTEQYKKGLLQQMFV